MQKIQVFLRDDQKTALKSIAARTGARQSALVRRGIDLLLESTAARKADWREAVRASAGLWRGRKDIDAFSAKLRGSLTKRLKNT